MDIMCTWTYRVRGGGAIYTSSTALMQPSFSGLLVTCAYLPHTTLPEGVTRPRSEQLTSMIVPLVITPDKGSGRDVMPVVTGVDAYWLTSVRAY
eukprot:scaffold66230_cov42-Phaeocystis_antarctica.AAC.2